MALLILSGGVIIAGGYDSGKNLNSVEALDTWTLPDLPHAVHAASLTAVGRYVYQCGGYTGRASSSACYKLNINAAAPRWTVTTSLPKPVYEHAAAAVSGHVWVSYGNFLYDLDTETDSFRTFSVPFTTSDYYCSVSNGTHNYIIGVGSKRDQVWVNKIPNKPSKWIRVATLTVGRNGIACVLHEHIIYVSGGYFSDTYYSVVEVIDTKTHEVRRIGDLNKTRSYHAMMVLDGNPAVVGGHSKDSSKNFVYYSDIEEYHASSQQWQVSSRFLQQKRSHFGLIQF